MVSSVEKKHHHHYPSWSRRRGQASSPGGSPGPSSASCPPPRRGDAAAAAAPAAEEEAVTTDAMVMAAMSDDDVTDVPETGAALAQARLEHAATRGQQARLLALASDTEADSDAEPPGSGRRGAGPPMLVGAHDRRRPLCDGAGLCSLGLWPPWRRPSGLVPQLARVRLLLWQYLDDLPLHLGCSAEVLFDRLAAGQVETDPFSCDQGALRQLVDDVLDTLSSSSVSARARCSDPIQPVRIRALQRILALGGDPDHRGMEHYGRGVRLGVSTRLPRTPAVFARKRR